MTTVTTLAVGVRALYGLSRGTQAVLSVAQPGLGALVASAGAGAGPPEAGRLLLALAAALAGYFAVFAANDLIDARVDRQRMARLRGYPGFDIDSAGMRHPLARGRLPFAVAAAWVGGLGATALVLAALVSRWCAALFVLAALLEAGYCALARVTPYKFLLSGLMVAAGGAAGWFVVTPDVDWPLFGLFCLWLAAWEIGGRNIVNDWADVEEDVHLGVRTVPVVFGPRVSGLLVAATGLVTCLAGAGVLAACAPVVGPPGLAGAVLAGGWALVWPALRLLRDPRPPTALALFNRASLYPALVLACALAAAALA